MPQGIIDIYEWLQSLINPSIFTLDSAEGVVVTVLALMIVYKITRNLGDFVGWLIGMLFMIQLGYVLGFTVLNDYIPFRDIFKLDVLAAPAQLFAGTKVANVILAVDAFMHYLAQVLATAFLKVFPSLRTIAETVFNGLEWGS